MSDRKKSTENGHDYHLRFAVSCPLPPETLTSNDVLPPEMLTSNNVLLLILMSNDVLPPETVTSNDVLPLEG